MHYEFCNGFLLEFQFKKTNFPHMIGLHKLKDMTAIQTYAGKAGFANQVLSKIKKGTLTEADIKTSKYFPLIQKRYEEFTLDNLPDESWTYLDSKTVQVGGSTKMAQVDFKLAQMEGPVLAVTVYSPEALGKEKLDRIDHFRKAALLHGLEVVMYGPAEGYETADRKSLMTLNRSNGGAVYFNDGTIVAKWANVELADLDLAPVLDEDPDVVILRHRIREQLYVSILIAGALVLMVLMRILCKSFIKVR